MVCFCIHSTTLCLLIGACSPFTFKVVINRYVLTDILCHTFENSSKTIADFSAETLHIRRRYFSRECDWLKWSCFLVFWMPFLVNLSVSALNCIWYFLMRKPYVFFMMENKLLGFCCYNRNQLTVLSEGDLKFKLFLNSIFIFSFTSSFFFVFFCLFRTTPTAYVGSQARGGIRAVASGLCQSHSNDRSEPHLLPTPQLMALPDP